MSEATSNKIIDASIDLISENGYAATSIRDIAKKAGVKTSTIYYYFESKGAILSSILNEYMNMLRTDEHRRKWYEEEHLVISGESEITVKEIMNYMFFKFQPSNAQRYVKMVKIFCCEAVVNKTVREHINDQNNDSFHYLKLILDSLLAAGKIPECDTVRLAGILRSIPFASMFMASIDIHRVCPENEDTNMFPLLEYILQIVMEGSL